MTHEVLEKLRDSLHKALDAMLLASNEVRSFEGAFTPRLAALVRMSESVAHMRDAWSIALAAKSSEEIMIEETERFIEILTKNGGGNAN